MTEQEAIKRIKEKHCTENQNCTDSCMHGAEHCAYSMAIKALEKQMNDGWIPCSERLPENEKVVDITYVVAFKDRNVYYTARGFYTDGTLTTERSSYCWSEMDNWEYCKEEDSYIIPEGWWEDVTFGEEFYAIDRKVVAWRERPAPYQPKRGDKLSGKDTRDQEL